MMQRLQKPQAPKKLESKTQPTQTYQRGYLPIWCRGIMGGCVNCGGCV